MNCEEMLNKILKHRDYIHRKRKESGFYDKPDYSDSKANRRSLRLQAMENKVIELEIEYMKKSKKLSERDSMILKNKTGGNEIMENNNLQKQVETENSIDREANTRTTLAISMIATAVKAGFQKDIVKEMLALAIAAQPKCDFIEFSVNIHDGTGVTRLQELYIHLNNGWKIERVQDNTKIDDHYYFTLVRSEDSPTVEEIKTKRTVDPREVYEILQTLESGLYAEPPYILEELLHNGTRKPFEVTKERYVKFFAEAALSNLHELLKDHTDDEGNFKE